MPSDPNLLAKETLLAVRTIENDLLAKTDAVRDHIDDIDDETLRDAKLDEWNGTLSDASANVDKALDNVFGGDTGALQSALTKTQAAQQATEGALENLSDIATTVSTIASAVKDVRGAIAALSKI